METTLQAAPAPAYTDSEPPLWAKEILLELHGIKESLAISVEKEFYTTQEVALRIGKSEWIVRQLCNKKRVPGAKKIPGRGRSGEWRIPHAAIAHIQNNGPLAACA